jgi:hypothetical protein
MNITDKRVWDKSKEGGGGTSGTLARLSRDWAVWAILILVASLCFGLGIIATRENKGSGDDFWIEQLPAEELGKGVGNTEENMPATTTLKTGGGPAAVVDALPMTKGTYVASKSGSKYYLPACSGAKRIKDENKIWFATKQEAESAGYEAATTCKGL